MKYTAALSLGLIMPDLVFTSKQNFYTRSMHAWYYSSVTEIARLKFTPTAESHGFSRGWIRL